MGDLDGTLGNGRSGRSHRQPNFLSIIDTLSELGSEVRHLADESRQPPLPKPPPGTRTIKQISNEAAKRTEFLHHSPPSVSADFQEYSEKIYDAVTKKSETIPRLRHSSNVNASTLSKHFTFHRNEFQNETTTSNFQKIRKSPIGGRERGRTPEWIKKIFDIAKTGDLEAIVS